LHICSRSPIYGDGFYGKRNPSRAVPTDDFVVRVVSDFVYDRGLSVALREQGSGMGVVSEGVARGCACVCYPRLLHIRRRRPCYYLRRRTAPNINFDGRGGKVKVRGSVGSRKRDGDREFEEVLMVSTGYFAECASDVAVPCRLNIGVSTIIYPRCPCAPPRPCF
jgi:hypothetical protein